jgi:tetratricopeptide (TPR) repeat protein
MTTVPLPAAFELAVAHHREGRLAQAEAVYLQILAADPSHAASLHMLGVLALQSDRTDLALERIQAAIVIDPRQPAFHNSLGEACFAKRDWPQAKACFRRAVELDPDAAGAHYNLGLLYQQEGDLDSAETALRHVLRVRPNLAEVHNELANLLRQQGDDQQALAEFRRALASNPDLAEAHNDLGNLLQDSGELDGAIESFEQAVRLQPSMAAAHYNLGNALRAANRKERAAASYRQAVELDANFAQAYNNLGTTLDDLCDPDGAMRAFVEAVRSDPLLAEARFNLATALQKCGNLEGARAGYLRAIELDPQHAASHFNLGSVCQFMKKWDEARDSYLEALRLRPDYTEAHCNLGVLHTNLGQYDEARARFDHILESQPNCAEAHCNRGMLLLGEGDYAAGWPEYAWYSKCSSYYGSRFAQPLWDGSPLEGRTILVVCDHGLGDTIQFVRYLPWIRRQGASRILLSAQRALHPLLAESGFGELVSPEQPPGDFDEHVPMVVLPALYYADQQTIDAEVPYLRASGELVERWRRELAPLAGLKIGICWQGSNRFPLNSLRSVPLADFAPLGGRTAAHLISLQQGDGREQLAEVANRFQVVDLGEDVDREQGAFMDTAAIIRNLDLVITSDTSMAHVAGALGARVWVAIAFASEWRWQRQGETSPWYPSMRLFRQESPGDWSGVMARMAAELDKLLLTP